MQKFFELSLLLVGLVLLFVGPLVWQLKSNIGPLSRLQSLADEAVRALDRPGSVEKYALRGGDSTVISKKESVTWFGYGVIVRAYSCTYFIRNSHGEYFMFIYTYGKREYLKHMSHDIARMKLREKYIEPASAC